MANVTPEEGLQTEADMAWLYGQLADLERRPELAEVYRSLAQSEARHLSALADHHGIRGDHLRPSWRARILARLARIGGIGLILPALAELEGGVAQVMGSGPLARESQRHQETLRVLSKRGGSSGVGLATLEGRHRNMGGNALRAAVLGANDGLVSNFCLLMGVAGAAVGQTALVLTGLAGLVGGAISMALGEWLSVQSSRELYQRQIEIERQELAASPEEEAGELALLYRAKGLSQSEAEMLASRMLANKETALDTLAREELGIDPAELGGSAWTAAATSFALFAVGAIIPLVPFFWVSGRDGVLFSALSSAVGLFLLGASISVMTGRNVWFSGGRQMLFGLVTAAVAFGVGRLFGISLSR